RQHDAAVARTSLNTDLADTDWVAFETCEYFVVADHEGIEVLDRAVLPANFTDLATDRNGDPFWLMPADVRGEFGAALAIESLLLGNCRLGQVDDGRAIDVDVVKTRVDRFANQVVDALHFTLGITCILLRVNLK